jgi:acetyl esterase/lipase
MKKSTKTTLKIILLVIGLLVVAVGIRTYRRNHAEIPDTSQTSEIKTAFNIRYDTKDSLQFADFYIPAEKSSTLLIIVHGGGWITGTKKDFSDVSNFFVEKGYVVANIDYRLAPKWKYDSQLQDIAAVLKLADAQKTKLKLKNGYKIALMGHSAGGQLVSIFSLKENDYGTKNVDYCIGLAGPYNLNLMGIKKPLVEKALINFLGNFTQDEASPAKQVKEGETTKFLLLLGASDEMVPEQQLTEFKDALTAKKAYVETYMIPWRTHESLYTNIPFTGNEVAEKILKFLEL